MCEYATGEMSLFGTTPTRRIAPIMLEDKSIADHGAHRFAATVFWKRACGVPARMVRK
jgi:hypothetical protein